MRILNDVPGLRKLLARCDQGAGSIPGLLAIWASRCILGIGVAVALLFQGSMALSGAALMAVDAPSITSFAAAPVTLTAGTSTTLMGVFSGGTGTVNNGVGAITSGVDITVTPSSTQTYILSVTDSVGSSVTQSVTVTVVPAPNGTITAASYVTASSTGLTASVPTQAGSTYYWTSVGGTITSGGTGNNIVYTAGQSGSVDLQCTVTNAAGTATTGLAIVQITLGLDSVYACWTFEEGSGVQTTDITGHGHTGILMNSPQWVNGKVGEALHFDGSSSYVNINNVNPFNGPFTVSAWVKFDAVNRAQNNIILSAGSASTNAGLMMHEGGGKPYFGFFGNDLQGNTTLQAGVWTHLVFIYDGIQKRIYVNGTLDSAQTSVAYQGTLSNAKIGQKLFQGLDVLLGTLDEVRIYDYALTDGEVNQLFASLANVVISPRAVTLNTSQTQTFSTSVSGESNTTVTWELPDANSGSITTGGVYSPPVSLPSQGVAYRVVARSQADPTQTDSVMVTVNSPVYVAPANVSLPLGGSLAFSAVVTGLSSSAVTWSVQESGGGSVNSSGAYQPPLTAGTYHVVATSTGDTSKQGIATVTIGNSSIPYPISGLIAYWPFDEGSQTTAKDATGLGNNGILVNGPLWVSGKEGTALHFDGTSTYVNIAKVNPFNGPFTVSAWVKFNAVNRSQNNIILSAGVASSNAGLMMHEGGGKPYFGFYGNDLQGNTTLQAGVWTHLVFMYNGTQKRIYVNGTLDSTQTSGPFLGAISNAKLGQKLFQGLDVLLGTLDEVRVYDRALSDAEVSQLYTSLIDVLILPRTSTINTSQTQTFTTTVSGSTNTAVTWELPDESSGNITAGGVYTPPSSLPYQGITYHVVARSQADTTQTDTATVTLNSPVFVAPSSASLAGSGSFAFNAIVSGLSSSTVTWSVQESAGGSISSAGVYTAPLTAGTYHVVATSTADSGQQGIATVTVINGSLPYPTSGLIAYWPFDGGSQNIARDATGLGNDAILVNGPQWVNGIEGKALHFDGLSTYASITTVNPFNGPFTVSAWVKFDVVNRAQNNIILSAGSGNTNAGLMMHEGGGKPYFGFFGNDLQGKTSLLAGIWTHLVFMYDGTQKKIYVNGVLDSTQTSVAYNGSLANAKLGQKLFQGLDVLLGTLDEVRVYARALTDAEVGQLYTSMANVVISPRAVTLNTSQTQTFSAAVSGSANTTVTWELPDASSGSITTGGVYTPPLTIPYQGITYHVVARSQADTTQTDTATVAVSSPVCVSPAIGSIPINGSCAFSAVVTSLSNTTVTWSVLEAAGGSVSSSGIYSAPSSAGTFHVVATSTAESSKQGTAAVIVGQAYAGPDVYLPFDEGEGSITQDESGFNRTVGALVNGPLWVAGKFGTALNFLGTNAVVTLSPSIALGPAWTISAWFQYPYPNTGTWHTLVRGALMDHQIIVNPDQISLGCYDNVNGGVFRDSGFKMNTLNAGWHHLAAVAEGGSTRFYLDGLTVGNVIPWQSTSDVYAIGNYLDGSQSFGVVDDLRVYRRALGGTEVAALYAATINVGIQPASPTLYPGQSQTFSAVVTGSTNTTVNWVLPDANSGSITTGGVYSAPASIPNEGVVYRVLAQSAADSTRFTTAYVTLRSPVAVTPSLVVLQQQATCQFTATTANLANNNVNWTCTGGTITTSGLYTAPQAAGTYKVTATSLADSSKSYSATVHVTMEISIIPTKASLVQGSKLLFLATASGSGSGSGNTAVNWSVWESLGGSIGSDGMYTAPMLEGAFHVNAVSQSDSTSMASALVTVTSLDPFRLQPDFVEIIPGSAAVFQLQGIGASSPLISWAVSGTGGGTVTQAGVYTAPTTPGTYQVVATSVSDQVRTAIGIVKVAAAVKPIVTVTPAEVDLSNGGAMTFMAQVIGGSTGRVSWSCTGGTINTTTGAFTAPSTLGSYIVTATSNDDGTAYGSATVTVNTTTATNSIYTYDANGNLTSDGARTLEWDAENRLVSVTITATGHRSEFGYDGFGRRVCIRELDLDTTQTLQVTSDTKYLWDGNEILQSRTSDGGTVLQQYFDQGFVDSDGTVLYYTKDHLGSIRELTDGAQTIQARFDYDPWGNMTQVSGKRTSPFGYGGYLWHAPSGLNMAIFRAYDSNIGRWINRDPIEERGGLNMYVYVSNKPSCWFDPLGLCPCHSEYGPAVGDSEMYIIKDCKESCEKYGDMKHCKTYKADPWDTQKWRNNNENTGFPFYENPALNTQPWYKELWSQIMDKITPWWAKTPPDPS